MFIRVMVAIGIVALVLALIVLTRVSHKETPPLSAKPMGTSTLSHGGPPAARPSPELPDRPGAEVRNQTSGGGTR